MWITDEIWSVFLAVLHIDECANCGIHFSVCMMNILSQQFIASYCTSFTGFSTDLTMVVTVFEAFFGAIRADLRAYFNKLGCIKTSHRQELSRGWTKTGTFDVQRNAFGHSRNILLFGTSKRTRLTSRHTLPACAYAIFIFFSICHHVNFIFELRFVVVFLFPIKTYNDC